MSKLLSSPDLVRPVVITDTQDLSLPQGTDDSILNDLPANPTSYSISDSEIDRPNMECPSSSLISDNASCDYFANTLQALIFDEHCKEVLPESQDHPVTPTYLAATSSFQVPPWLLCRQHRNIQPSSPPFTRSRATLSSSSDIISTQ